MDKPFLSGKTCSHELTVALWPWIEALSHFDLHDWCYNNTILSIWKFNMKACRSSNHLPFSVKETLLNCWLKDENWWKLFSWGRQRQNGRAHRQITLISASICYFYDCKKRTFDHFCSKKGQASVAVGGNVNLKWLRLAAFIFNCNY